MPRIDVVVQAPIHDSFRVRQVAGLFDVPLQSKSELRFEAELPGLDEDWTLGAIVGPSGSGKSTIARQAFTQGDLCHGSLINGFDWPKDKAVVDGFDDDLDGKQITGTLNAVGFSSPPAWIKPWQVLSNGEKFRCDLARALLTDQPVIAFDEFTSVVDRQVARFGSAAVAKALRSGRSRCKQFVAVTCHYDILPWLSPDWWFDMATGKLARGCLQRPSIRLEIRACKRSVWRLFKRYHYLSSNLNPVARCYIATWNDQPVGFCSTIHLYGHKKRRIIHRLVVLPDYQGLGVGTALLDETARIEAVDDKISIVTSHPALVRSLARNPRWRCGRVVRCGKPHEGHLRKTGKKIGSMGRMTASFVYREVA